MIEAYVICRWSIRIADLDRKLEAGQVYWLSLEEARNSKDLSHAAKIGAVKVHRKERFRMVRPKYLPPHAKLSRKGPQHRTSPVRGPRQVTTPQVQAKPKGPDSKDPPPETQEPQVSPKIEVVLDPEKIAAALAPTVERLVQEQLTKQQSETTSPVDADVLAEAISKAMAKNPVAVVSNVQGSPVSKGSISSSEPLYIPSDLGKDAKGTVKLKTEDVDDTVDDAAAALRALRKKRK